MLQTSSLLCDTLSSSMEEGPRQRLSAVKADGSNIINEGQPVENFQSTAGPGSTLSADNGVGLKKRVGLIGGVSLIVGTMIGSGIFISPKGVAAGSGSVGLSLISWTLCGVIAMLGSLCYAELGTFILRSGAEHAYLMSGLHQVFAFLFAWMSIALLKPASLAIIALTCSQYIMVPLFEDGCGLPPEVIRKLLSSVVI